MPRPVWCFGLDPATAWLTSHGLPTRWSSPRHPLSADRWSALRADAGRHRLGGLLVHAVASGVLVATADQRHEVARIEIDLTRAAMAAEDRLGLVASTLDGAGIDMRVLKGLATATLDYPDPQMRPTGDVDVLVRADQIDRAADVLLALGGRRTDPDPVPGLSCTVAKGATLALDAGFEVDLHRILVWGPIGVRVPPGELWRTSRSFVVGDRPYRALGGDEALVHACLHLLVGGWRRALSLRDVAQMITRPSLDPASALSVAAAWGATAVLAEGIAVTAADLALDDDVPLVDWALRYEPSIRDRLWLRVDRSDDPLGALQAFGVLVEQRTSAERALLLRATFAPAPGTWPSPAHRVARVLRRGCRRLRP